MITIKNPDKEIVTGKLTIYEDVPDTILEDLNCPCCRRPMLFTESDRLIDQTGCIHNFRFSCSSCHLEFLGLQDYYHFNDVVDFYTFVKDRLNEQNNT